MKTKNKLYLLAVTTTAALTLSATTSIGQVFSARDVMNNRAVAASPRAKEEYPWLTRSGVEPTQSQEGVTTSKDRLAKIRENSALAASPRMKELYPELAWSAVSANERTVATGTGNNSLAVVRRNSALAASPRMKELYPELRVDAEKPIEVAPIK